MVYNHNVFIAMPSSTEMRTFESGLSAIADIFFRFSNANVDDLLLVARDVSRIRCKALYMYALYQVEDGHAISDRT
jgi:hypothetical protein